MRVRLASIVPPPFKPLPASIETAEWSMFLELATSRFRVTAPASPPPVNPTPAMTSVIVPNPPSTIAVST